jgi:ferredoxin
MKVTIDQDKCVASGQCVTAAMRCSTTRVAAAFTELAQAI